MIMESIAPASAIHPYLNYIYMYMNDVGFHCDERGKMAKKKRVEYFEEDSKPGFEICMQNGGKAFRASRWNTCEGSCTLCNIGINCAYAISHAKTIWLSHQNWNCAHVWWSLARINFYTTQIYCMRNKTIELCSFAWNTPIERQIHFLFCLDGTFTCAKRDVICSGSTVFVLRSDAKF